MQPLQPLQPIAKQPKYANCGIRTHGDFIGLAGRRLNRWPKCAYEAGLIILFQSKPPMRILTTATRSRKRAVAVFTFAFVLVQRAQQDSFKCCLSFKEQGTSGLVAMTSASHAEGRQFDPGLVYISVSRVRLALRRLPQTARLATIHTVAFAFLLQSRFLLPALGDVRRTHLK